jgi:hypothetical protein
MTQNDQPMNVSPKWFHGYLNEHTWRRDRRADGSGMVFSLILRAAEA